jgi:hypothetical protein
MVEVLDMADVIQRKTNGPRDDILVYADDTVTVNGSPAPDAIVTHHEGIVRVALDTAEPKMLFVNPVPPISRIRITRIPGWNDVMGWKAELMDSVPEVSPGVISLAVYQHPEADGYLYTTGAFVLDEETGLWGCVCPAGHEEGVVDYNFSMLYASVKYSPFTLFSNFDEMEFTVGGDLE